MDRADCRNTEPSPFGLVVKLELLLRRHLRIANNSADAECHREAGSLAESGSVHGFLALRSPVTNAAELNKSERSR
jgi:hypothetical protein